MVREKTGSAKRYGVRYGHSNRVKVGSAERQYNKRTLCPYCKKEAVKREAAGIFVCSKCGSKFAAKAYSSTLTSVKK